MVFIHLLPTHGIKRIDLTMAQLLLWFDQIHKDDVPLVGGKSASLREMTSRTKVPVPYGFALTADAYRFFLRESKLEIKIADALRLLRNPNDTVTLQKVGGTIREADPLFSNSEGTRKNYSGSIRTAWRT